MKYRIDMTKLTPLLALMAILLTGVQSTDAATLFDNGSGLNANGLFADTEYNHVVADDFVFGGAATVTSLTWSGTYWPDNVPASPDVFQIFFLSDAGGTPGALISMQTVPVSRVDSGANDVNYGLDIYSYSANIIPVAFAAGTYWLGLTNDTTTSPSWWLWAGGPQTFGAGSKASFDGGLTFPGNDTATPQKNFILSDNAVPEPSSALLLGFGALAVCFRRIRKR